MALVIANLKFLLDQVGHTGTGPQRCLIAQLLWASQQELFEFPPLLLIQARLAAGAAGLPQSRLAFRPVLLHPARYGLPDHAELPRNLGLSLSTFPQLDRLKATLLQSIKIASHSSRISHT